jgi:hypothetical protein
VEPVLGDGCLLVGHVLGRPLGCSEKATDGVRRPNDGSSISGTGHARPEAYAPNPAPQGRIRALAL